VTGFWIAAALMTLGALAVLLVPLWRESRQGGKLKLSGPLAALAIVPVSLGLYLLVTTYDPDRFESPASAELMSQLRALAARLGESPDDVQGWMLLGRSYRTLGDYELARRAFEQAWQRTETPDTTLKLSYAEALLFTDRTAAQGLAGDLIDEVLESSPTNQAALWLGGIVAVERNQPGLAGQRFTAFLATNPPPEIADIVRGELVALAMPESGAPSTVAAAPSGPVIELDVSVAEGMMPDALAPSALLYVFARPAGGGPPLAVKQLPVASLPGRIELSDADAIAGMAAGRSLGDQESVTIVARISRSGQATEQPGDVYGEIEVDPEAGEPVSLTLDRIVPDA